MLIFQTGIREPNGPILTRGRPRAGAQMSYFHSSKRYVTISTFLPISQTETCSSKHIMAWATRSFMGTMDLFTSQMAAIAVVLQQMTSSVLRKRSDIPQFPICKIWTQIMAFIPGTELCLLKGRDRIRLILTYIHC